MIAVDIDAGKIWWGKNGSWFASGNPSAGTGAGFSGLSSSLALLFGANSGSGTKVGTLTEIASYAYSPPSGFTAGWGGGTGSTYDESASMGVTVEQAVVVANTLGLSITQGFTTALAAERFYEAAAVIALEVTAGLTYATVAQLEPTISFATTLDGMQGCALTISEVLMLAVSLLDEQVGGTLYGVFVEWNLLFNQFVVPSSAFDDSLTFGLTLDGTAADNLGDIELSVDWVIEHDVSFERGRVWEDVLGYALSLGATLTPGNVVGVSAEWEWTLALATAGDRGTLENSVSFGIATLLFNAPISTLELPVALGVSAGMALATQATLAPTLTFGLSLGLSQAATARFEPTLLFGLAPGVSMIGGRLLEGAASYAISLRTLAEIVDYDQLISITADLDLGLFGSFETWFSKRRSGQQAYTGAEGAAGSFTPKSGGSASFTAKGNKEDPDWQGGNVSGG